jgi:HSP20 family molecular chaperone IbpA
MEKFMGGHFPFMNDKIKKKMGAGGTDWVEEYVQDVLKKSFSQRTGSFIPEESARAETSEAGQGLDYDYETFETHHNVIVRITVPEDVQVKNVRLYAGSMQLKVEQDPTRSSMYIPLPSEVDGGGVKASLKDRVLEVRCPRRQEAEVFQEVRVRFL